MNLRTSWDRMKSDPLHIVWIIGYSLVGAIVFSLSGLRAVSPSDESRFILTPFPYFYAGGLLISDGLKRFSGEPIVHMWNPYQTGILLSIIVSYVLALPVFFWGWSQRARRRMEQQKRGFPLRIVLALGFSAPVVVLITFFSITGAFLSNSVWNTMLNAQRSGGNRDYTMRMLSMMALNAQSFSHVPVAQGGGGGKWININRRPTSILTLEDVALRDQQAMSFLEGLFPQQPPSFRLEVFDEDSLGIWGVGNEPGEVERFANKDGREGRVQAYAIVTPRHAVVRVQN